MASLIVFLAAMLVFFGLFGQTIETAIEYQQHSALAQKTSDLLDNILLNPGDPYNWSQTDLNPPPIRLGVQDPEFVQYQLSALSLMRLRSTTGTDVTYQGQNYRNTTLSLGCSLLVPSNQIINYSQASKMLGTSGSYGFSLTVSPTIDVSVSEEGFSPLNVSVSVKGQGFPLSNATITYCLITVTGFDPPGYPSYTLNYGTISTNTAGLVYLDLSSFDVTQKSYAIIVYASLSGMSGVGFLEHPMYSTTSVVPIISSFKDRTILLAHSYGLNSQGYNGNVTYTAALLRAKDFIPTTLGNGQSTAKGVLYLDSSPSHPSDTISLDPNTFGVIMVAYSKSALESGIVFMPWGISSLDFSVTFGDPNTSQNWVATDMRQVLINGVTYQAKLALWESKVSGVN
jgi:hypothetical protein